MTTEWRSTNENAYFAASNARDGFHSFYEDGIRRRVDHLYCIKGGPGTGKSRLLREIAQAGECHGNTVEYFYCSSDTHSLDGIILKDEHRTIGFVDATAPHIVEPILPGVREEILDLGVFWNSALLAAHTDEIRALNEQKNAAYRTAYRFMSGAGDISDNLTELLKPFLYQEKLERTAARLMRIFPDGNGFVACPALCSAISLQGRVRLDTYLRMGKHVVAIENYYDTAYTLMAHFLEQAKKKKLACRVSYHPLYPDRIDALFIEESQTVFIVCEAGDAAMSRLGQPDRTIFMRQYVHAPAFRPHRESARYYLRLREALIDCACQRLTDAERAHFALEKIYMHSMDFQAKEEFTHSLLSRLFPKTTP